MKENNFKYEVLKNIGVLKTSGNVTTEINLISFNGGEPKYDIRKWDKVNNKMYKGITLSKEEMKILKLLLNNEEI